VGDRLDVWLSDHVDARDAPITKKIMVNVARVKSMEAVGN